MKRFVLSLVCLILSVVIYQASYSDAEEYDFPEEARIASGNYDDHAGDVFFRLYMMGRLRDATPVDDPAYQAIEKRYRELSDLAENRIYRAIKGTSHTHHWIESRSGVKFCKWCGIYAVQHINGEWLLVGRDAIWIGAEPR